jgi:hypothetical protein
MKYDKATLREQQTSIHLETAKSFDQPDLGFFFAYHIFPFNIMTSLTQWEYEKRKMRVGDTILQQIFIPPLPGLSQKLIFGVRINSITDEIGKKGFSYETLEGHVERGESSFVIQLRPTPVFTITTFSEPSNPLLRLIGPVAARPYQAYCTRKAMSHVKRQLT